MNKNTVFKSLFLLVPTLVLVGCGSPPSVLPTLRVVQEAIEAEAEHVQRDTQRDQLVLTQTLDSLERAFDADLETRAELDRVWVKQAVTGYTAAREAVLEHGRRVADERAVRRDNLAAMAEAQSRAIVLLESQDRWLQRTLGVDLWRLEQLQERNGLR